MSSLSRIHCNTFRGQLSHLSLLLFMLIVASPILYGQSANPPALPTFAEDDPALLRIIVWQLDRGEKDDAEKLLKANLVKVKSRLEDVVKDIDKEFDILGRFGAVSIHFGPGYGDLEAKNQSYEKLFDLYKKLGGDDNLYKRFESRRLRVSGAHFTNQGENICGDTGDWDGAQKVYDQALESLNGAFNLAKELGDYRLMASAKINIGSAMMRLQRPAEAIKAYNEGMQYAEKAPGDLYKGLVRLNLGNTFVWTGDADKSIPYSQQALAIFKKIGRGTWEANALMNLGNAYIRQQRYADAWETLRVTLDVARQNGEYRVYGRALMNLGMAGIQLKKPEAAKYIEEGLEWYRNDKEIYPPIEREVIKQDALRFLSQSAKQSGNAELAEKYNKEFFESLGPDPEKYQAMRESPCFAIYKAKPVTKTASVVTPAKR